MWIDKWALGRIQPAYLLDLSQFSTLLQPPFHVAFIHAAPMIPNIAFLFFIHPFLQVENLVDPKLSTST